MREIPNSIVVNNNAIDSMIEGSLQYREMKRLYLNEKKQSDEWRKDYKILKQQLVDLRASTIRK